MVGRMSETWFDLAPPATWQRFEELCADTFEAVFRDPALVRYGRSGQRQDGVDILATDGALGPIGLQCKRKGRWPVGRLTAADIDAEVARSLAFTPPLRAFYILTTAPADKALTDHAAALTAAHGSKRLFPVHVLGWQEICRRATLHPAVARKHFGIFGGDPPQPLLATWTTTGGRIDADDRELALAIRELRHAWRAQPGGRLVVRQRESDQLAASIRAIPVEGASRRRRLERLALQDRLEALEEGERFVGAALRLLLTDRELEYYPGCLHREHAPAMVRAIVERRLDRDRRGPGGDYKLKLVSPVAGSEDVSSFLHPDQADEVRAAIGRRQVRFGHDATETLAVLPSGVMATVAIPLVVHRLVQLMDEGATLDGLRAGGMLRIGSWRVARAY